jgi:serine/threonine protein kinase
LHEPPASSRATLPAAGTRADGGASPGKPGSSNALPAGVRLRHYEISGLVGAGGFGIVYTARDHRLERTVAIKEYMPSSLAARRGALDVAPLTEGQREAFDAGLKSFINEARMLAGFEHPNLVQVFDFWHENGTAYMVMPYCRGVSLRTVLQQLDAPPSEAWLKALLRPLLDALALLHGRNCVHRDISPDNIQILPNGSPLLLDFGAAREVRQGSPQPLTVILRPGFAPVEQYAEGTTSPQGPWTDLYALAAVIHFAITGAPPKTAVARLVARDSTPLGDAAAGHYGRRFLAGLDAALAVKPEDRPASVAEFATAIGLDEAKATTDDDTAPLHAPSANAADGPGTDVTVAADSPRLRDAIAVAAASDAAPAAPRAPEILLRRAAVIGIGGLLAFAVALSLGWYAWRSPLPSPATAARPAALPPPATRPAADDPQPTVAAPIEAAPAARTDAPAPPPVVTPSPPVESNTAKPAVPSAETTQRPAAQVVPPNEATAAPIAVTPAAPSAERPAPEPPPPTRDAGRPTEPRAQPFETGRHGAGRGDRVDAAGKPPAAGTAERRHSGAVPAREEKTGTGARCSDVLMRMQMGETLSEQENASFQKECKR